jgi:protein-L-isoaspartate(D-aspartate) O-methyltransferase
MSADLAAARTSMVESQVRTADVTDLTIVDAIRSVAREGLVPPGKQWLAYADTEVEYAPGRWLLKPRDIAKLLQAVRPRAGERALAIAAPYGAAVLEAMSLSVERLDGADLTPITGEHDVVICEGAVPKAPQSWIASLALGGRLAVVERSGVQGRAVLYVRSEDGIGARPLFDATPPLLAGFEPAQGFAF